jgi:hypothetical protein
MLSPLAHPLTDVHVLRQVPLPVAHAKQPVVGSDTLWHVELLAQQVATPLMPVIVVSLSQLTLVQLVIVQELPAACAAQIPKNAKQSAIVITIAFPKRRVRAAPHHTH